MRSIGIDIGSSSIKIAEVISTSQGFLLQDFAEFLLSPEPGADQRIEIITHLRKVSAHYGQTGIRYVVCLPQEQLAVRPLIFPFKERHNILRSLTSQLEDDIPFDQDDAIFDAKILRYHGTKAEVLALACPKKNIQNTLQLFYDAGIDPDIVTVDAPAMANFFESWSFAPRDIPNPKVAKESQMVSEATMAGITTGISEQTLPAIEAIPPCQVVINMGHRRTLLSVFYRNTLLTTRTFSRGGHEIVEGLRRGYSLPYHEALKGLEEKGFVLASLDGATQDQIDFSNVIVSGLKPLIEDIKLTLLEIRSQFDIEFNQIYLTGGVSRLMNIGSYFSQQLELPCSLFKYMERVPKTISEDSPSLEYGSLLVICVAIEGLKRPRNPAINLRRLEFSKQSQSLKIFTEKWGMTLKYAAVALAVFYVYSFTRDMLAERLETASRVKVQDTARDSFSLKGKTATESKLKQFIRDKKNELEAKKDLAELQTLNSALDVINQLSEKMPAKSQIVVDVRRLLLKNENLTVEGEVSQQSHVELVRNALTSQSTDRKVRDMSPSIKPSQGKLAFAFSLKVNRK